MTSHTMNGWDLAALLFVMIGLVMVMWSSGQSDD